MLTKFAEIVLGYVRFCQDEKLSTHPKDRSVPPHAVCFHGKRLVDIVTDENANLVGGLLEKRYNAQISLEQQKKMHVLNAVMIVDAIKEWAISREINSIETEDIDGGVFVWANSYSDDSLKGLSANSA